MAWREAEKQPRRSFRHSLWRSSHSAIRTGGAVIQPTPMAEGAIAWVEACIRCMLGVRCSTMQACKGSMTAGSRWAWPRACAWPAFLHGVWSQELPPPRPAVWPSRQWQRRKVSAAMCCGGRCDVAAFPPSARPFLAIDVEKGYFWQYECAEG
jgi:hypothetical protein